MRTWILQQFTETAGVLPMSAWHQHDNIRRAGVSALRSWLVCAVLWHNRMSSLPIGNDFQGAIIYVVAAATSVVFRLA